MFVASMVCLSTAFIMFLIEVRIATNTLRIGVHKHDDDAPRLPHHCWSCGCRRRVRHRPERPGKAADHGAGHGIRAARRLAPARPRQHSLYGSAGRAGHHRARAAFRAGARRQHQGSSSRKSSSTACRSCACRTTSSRNGAMPTRRAPPRARCASCRTKTSSPGARACPSSNYPTATAMRPRPAGSTVSPWASSANLPARRGSRIVMACSAWAVMTGPTPAAAPSSTW